MRSSSALLRGCTESSQQFKLLSLSPGVLAKSKDRSPNSSCSNARCMDVPTSICCVCACCMWLDLLQQLLTALFPLVQACAMVDVLTFAAIFGEEHAPLRLFFCFTSSCYFFPASSTLSQSSKAGESHEVGNPYRSLIEPWYAFPDGLLSISRCFLW
jgi:hypothetical protein